MEMKVSPFYDICLVPVSRAIMSLHCSIKSKTILPWSLWEWFDEVRLPTKHVNIQAFAYSHFLCKKI